MHKNINKTENPKPSASTPHRYLPRKDRILEGKLREFKVVQKLKEDYKFEMEMTDPAEDMEGKDAFLYKNVRRSNGITSKEKYSVQVKYRQGGDDLLFEIAKPLAVDNNGDFVIPTKLSDTSSATGKDAKATYTYYIHLNKTADKIMLFDGVQIRFYIQKMLDAAKSPSIWRDNTSNNGTIRIADVMLINEKASVRAQLKIRHDPSNGVIKLLAYLPPDILTVMWQGKTDLHTDPLFKPENMDSYSKI